MRFELADWLDCTTDERGFFITCRSGRQGKIVMKWLARARFNNVTLRIPKSGMESMIVAMDDR